MIVEQWEGQMTDMAMVRTPNREGSVPNEAAFQETAYSTSAGFIQTVLPPVGMQNAFQALRDVVFLRMLQLKP